MCDGLVWLHLLKQTTEFSKKTLEGLVDFVPENRRSELMPEVLRTAARRFPSFEALRASQAPLSASVRRGPCLLTGQNPAKIIWTLKGWSAAETFSMEGNIDDVKEYYTYNGYYKYKGHYFNNLKEFTDVAKAVRIAPTILEVQGYTTGANLKRITDLVEQQGEKLASCEWTDLCTSFGKEVFFALQRMSMKWKVKMAKVSAGIGGNYIELAALAGSSLDNGHIGSLVVIWNEEQVNFLPALKRVWEIADEMHIRRHHWAQDQLEVGGGRGEDSEEAWLLVLNFFLS